MSKRFHHGRLREALLEAAEAILIRDGIDALTLRGAAREAGVSHAAPKNHFANLTELLSDLAAIGFERFADFLQRDLEQHGKGGGDDRGAWLNEIGKRYVVFAEENPGLFLLMFRSERLDAERPALKTAMRRAFATLSGAVGAHDGDEGPSDHAAYSGQVEEGEPAAGDMTLEQAASVARAWAMVHGFAMLSMDGRLGGILARSPEGTDKAALLNAVLGRPTSDE